MLGWAIIFLILAIAAAILGFGVFAGTAAWTAKILFIAFAVLFLIALIVGLATGQRRGPP